MADYIFTQHGNNNVQIGDMTGMPYHVNTALKWALEHNFQSVAAQYSKTLALEVVRLREDNERLCAALQSSKKRAADYEQTGLTPDELTDLRRHAENNQVRYVSEAAECERLRIEIERLRAENDELKDVMIRACVWLDVHGRTGIPDVTRTLSEAVAATVKKEARNEP